MTPIRATAAPERLASRLDEARARTDEIFDRLQPSALYDRPIPERHRLVFYLGHLEAFDWNLIARRAFGLPAFREDFDRLFAFGIDPVGGGLPNEPASDWPPRDAIDAYNRRVREVVDGCVAGEHPARIPDAGTVIEMAIEHRLMHAETLAYLLHQLPYGMKVAPDAETPAPVARDVAATRSDWIEILAGTATLGRRRAEPGFGWDNEHEAHGVPVPGFGIERHKVTNARYLEFVRDGGYRQRTLWSDADWEWKEKEGIRHPYFWLERDGAWRWRGMFAELPLPLAAPVYVSHAEAAAFARWSGGDLPTEAQFHRAAFGTPGGVERAYPWGDDAPEPHRGNFDFRRWDATPVGSFPAGASAFGLDEPVGNGWEWTRTVFAPFAGFEAHPFYAGYSADFFDGHHYVMKGGSARTAACMLRRSFRNWFQPHYPYVHAAFRQVRS